MVKEATEEGKAKAQFKIGMKYARGEGVTQDYKEAAVWFEKAANKRDPDAQTHLGAIT